MASLATGFAVIGFAILAGFVVGKARVLPAGARTTLSNLVFYLLSPVLLFDIISRAELGRLLSDLLPVSILAFAICGLLYAGVSAVLWRRRLGEVTIGVLSASYVNANNIGLPIAIYVLGDPSFVVPIVLFQHLVVAPAALAILASTSGPGSSVRAAILRSITTPLIVASALGAVVSILGLQLPTLVAMPVSTLGAAAVPVMLVAFGLSLAEQSIATAHDRWPDTIAATAIKVAVMPTIAFLLGRYLFELDSGSLLSVTVLAALPTAQNIFTFAQRYEVGETVARDSGVLTTILSVPALVVITLLL